LCLNGLTKKKWEIGVGDFADDALNQSMDEWLSAMEEEDLENEYWVGYSWRPRSMPRPLKSSGPGLCPICKSNTILRSGQFGDFYGCSKFPECRGSRKI
jgi:hypothetical protein